jgi:hypothetical protein
LPGHEDSAACRFGEIEAVHTHPVPGDDLQVRGDGEYVSS